MCVIQVGTVGHVPDGLLENLSGADVRVNVQHAALVLVHPASGSMDRFEVLTDEQMNPLVGQVLWHRGGLAPMDPKLVRLHAPTQLVMHLSPKVIKYTMLVMKYTMLVMKSTMVVMHDMTVVMKWYMTVMPLP